MSERSPTSAAGPVAVAEVLPVAFPGNQTPRCQQQKEVPWGFLMFLNDSPWGEQHPQSSRTGPQIKLERPAQTGRSKVSPEQGREKASWPRTHSQGLQQPGLRNIVSATKQLPCGDAQEEALWRPCQMSRLLHKYDMSTHTLQFTADMETVICITLECTKNKLPEFHALWFPGGGCPPSQTRNGSRVRKLSPPGNRAANMLIPENPLLPA